MQTTKKLLTKSAYYKPHQVNLGKAYCGTINGSIRGQKFMLNLWDVASGKTTVDIHGQQFIHQQTADPDTQLNRYQIVAAIFEARRLENKKQK